MFLEDVNSSHMVVVEVTGTTLKVLKNVCKDVVNIFIHTLFYQLITGNKCEDDEPVQCLINPCDTVQCPNISNATCVPSTCGQCSARFYNTSGYDVTNQCSK